MNNFGGTTSSFKRLSASSSWLIAARSVQDVLWDYGTKHPNMINGGGGRMMTVAVDGGTTKAIKVSSDSGRRNSICIQRSPRVTR